MVGYVPDARRGGLQADVVVDLSCGLVKDPHPSPRELHLGVAHLVHDLDLVEGLRDKVGDGLVALDHEAHGGELAAAVAEELVGLEAIV